MRRAFTPEEFTRLLEVSGRRKLLYQTAAYTGLRRGEIAQLDWQDVHLDSDRPFLKVRSSTTKNKKEAIIPLHPKLAVALSAIKPNSAGRVFPSAITASKCLPSDCDKAGIERIDSLGRKVDFHALRYTFATMMAKQGVSQRLAQELMRHSDPQLTAKIYTDASQLPTYEAVTTLPWSENETSPLAAANPQIDPQKPDSEGLLLSQIDNSNFTFELLNPVDGQPVSLVLAMPGTARQMVPPRGLEPRTN
ncbi:tyrosine-type recombinase/integrase [Cerasicoccus frondis]|uniref:tyrosine-type recombinase/integrase n=1 Tax=Cerasicoccus frondis TaxID=490090 RepID=UPI003CCE285B